MKFWFRSYWWWLALLLLIVAAGSAFFLHQSKGNVVHPALDKLAAIGISERWSRRELLKIRELGVKAVPSLRHALREKDSPTTRFLLWVQGKFPNLVKYYSHFPDSNKLTQRRGAACQVLQVLGPAATSATPELIEIANS